MPCIQARPCRQAGHEARAAKYGSKVVGACAKAEERGLFPGLQGLNSIPMGAVLVQLGPIPSNSHHLLRVRHCLARESSVTASQGRLPAAPRGHPRPGHRAFKDCGTARPLCVRPRCIQQMLGLDKKSPVIYQQAAASRYKQIFSVAHTFI